MIKWYLDLLKLYSFFYKHDVFICFTFFKMVALFLCFHDCCFIKLWLKLIKLFISFEKGLLYVSKRESSLPKGLFVINRLLCSKLSKCCTYFCDLFHSFQVLLCILSVIVFLYNGALYFAVWSFKIWSQHFYLLRSLRCLAKKTEANQREVKIHKANKYLSSYILSIPGKVHSLNSEQVFN